MSEPNADHDFHPPALPPGPPDQQQLFLLGQIHAMVQGLKSGQAATNTRLDKMDERLRAVEQRSAAVGAVSGGAMAIGVTLIVEALKEWARRGPPHLP